MTRSQVATLEPRRLAALVPHPDQGKFFADLDSAALRALAADIGREGLKCPIEILPKNAVDLPANTILCGHQRRRALLLNGVTVSQVLVRYDLAGGPVGPVQRRFLDDNMLRRQLGDLDKARAAVAMFQLDSGGRYRLSEIGGYASYLSVIQRTLCVSERHARRVSRVLRAPAAVQRAYADGLVTLATAAAVCDLPRGVLDTMDAALAATANPRTAIQAAVAAKRPLGVHLPAAVARIVRDVGQIADTPPDRIDGLSEAQRGGLAAALLTLQTLVGRLAGGRRRAT